MLICRNALFIFKNDEQMILDAGFSIADQVRIIVRESRAKVGCLLVSGGSDSVISFYIEAIFFKLDFLDHDFFST